MTNKAAALARFLQRKIAAGQGSSLDPALVEKAVENAKASLDYQGQLVGMVWSYLRRLGGVKVFNFASFFVLFV